MTEHSEINHFFCVIIYTSYKFLQMVRFIWPTGTCEDLCNKINQSDDRKFVYCSFLYICFGCLEVCNKRTYNERKVYFNAVLFFFYCSCAVSFNIRLPTHVARDSNQMSSFMAALSCKPA